jgi:hypothetical protein
VSRAGHSRRNHHRNSGNGFVTLIGFGPEVSASEVEVEAGDDGQVTGNLRTVYVGRTHPETVPDGCTIRAHDGPPRL